MTSSRNSIRRSSRALKVPSTTWSSARKAAPTSIWTSWWRFADGAMTRPTPYERGRLVVTALRAGQFTFEVVQRAARGTPPARVPTFAHVGKIHPVGNDRDSCVFGEVRFAHVGKTDARHRERDRDHVARPA